MKRLLAGLALPILFATCRDGPLPTETQAPDPAPAPAVQTDQASLTLDGQMCVDLIADQTVVMGEVCVINDVTQLLVRYETQGGWTLYKTHLAVAPLPEDIPQTRKGNPVPGQFPYKAQHDAGRTSYLYSVPLAEIGAQPGDEVVVAAHATVVDPAGGQEGAWCGSEGFGSKNWALFTRYSLADDVQGSGFVGPEGGTVGTADGSLALAVPPGALASVVGITIKDAPDPPPGDGAIPGTEWELGPDGVQFDPPAELTVFYDPASVPAGLGDPADALTLGRRSGGPWEEAVSTVDPETHSVTGLVYTFSLWTILKKIRWIDVIPNPATVPLGKSLQLQAISKDASDAPVDNRALSWGSLDPSVAGVDQSGLVTGAALGSTTVWATGVLRPCPPSPYVICTWSSLERVFGTTSVVVGHPPVANAGPDQTVTDSDNSGSEDVTLDGSGSTDPEDNIATYEWFRGGITGTQIATSVNPTVALTVGVHTLTLLVTDVSGLSDTDEVDIAVQPWTPPPDQPGKIVFISNCFVPTNCAVIERINPDGTNRQWLASAPWIALGEQGWTIGDLSFSPDGKSLAITMGPAWPPSAEKALYVVPFHHEQNWDPQQPALHANLAPSLSAPEWTATGIFFLRDQNIFGVQPGNPASITPAFQQFPVAGFAFSPDTNRFAVSPLAGANLYLATLGSPGLQELGPFALTSPVTVTDWWPGNPSPGILFHATPLQAQEAQIFRLSAEDPPTPVPIAGQEHGQGAAWAPDGRFFAFVSRRDGQSIGDVYVKEIGGPIRRLTDSDGVLAVDWSLSLDPFYEGHWHGRAQYDRGLHDTGQASLTQSGTAVTGQLAIPDLIDCSFTGDTELHSTGVSVAGGCVLYDGSTHPMGGFVRVFAPSGRMFLDGALYGSIQLNFSSFTQ